MPREALRLAGPALLTNAAATKYTVPASTKTILRWIHVENPSAAAVSFTLSIGVDAAGTRLFDAIFIPAVTDISKGIFDYFCNLPLEAAEIVQAWAPSATNVMTLTLEGDVYTPG